MGIEYTAKEKKRIHAAWEKFTNVLEADLTAKRMVRAALKSARSQATNITEACVWLMDWFERGYTREIPLALFFGMRDDCVTMAVIGAQYRVHPRAPYLHVETVVEFIRDVMKDHNAALTREHNRICETDKTN